MIQVRGRHVASHRRKRDPLEYRHENSIDTDPVDRRADDADRSKFARRPRPFIQDHGRACDTFRSKATPETRRAPVALVGTQLRTYGRTGLREAPPDGLGDSIAIRAQTVAPTAIEPITENNCCQISDGMVSAATPRVA